ncbi:MAG TPA: hypothetical protein VFA70_10445 [Dehalococcoidia bacterium]|jgi:hypothetical protein|nr:hypothetical protein [Dehalococcoidia bacterium]
MSYDERETSGYAFLFGSFNPVNASQNAAINNPQSNTNVGVQNANTVGLGLFHGAVIASPSQTLTNVAANVSNNGILQSR